MILDNFLLSREACEIVCLNTLRMFFEVSGNFPRTFSKISGTFTEDSPSDKTIRTLGSSQLSLINLRRCGSLTSQGIWSCLQRCSALTSLNLAFCKLETEFVELLCDFSCLSSLKLLDLSGFKQLNDGDLKKIMENEVGSEFSGNFPLKKLMICRISVIV